MSKSKFYQGQEGCLKFIADIALDYDGVKSVEGLKTLIDEIRKEAIKGIAEKENYGK
jgi:hypothetical protein